MKIGLIVPGFSADEQDWCIPAVLNLARSLASSHQVNVLALRYPHRRDLYSVGAVTVQSLNGQSRRGLASVDLWRSALAALAAEHRRRRFDVLHAIWGGEAGFIAVLASRLLRVPSVVSLVGGELVGLDDIGYGSQLLPRQRLMNQFVLRFADRILCGSSQLTHLAHTRVSPSRRNRVQTLTLGVDTQMFSPLPSAERNGSIQFLNVGSLIPVKGQSILLQAFGQIQHSLPGARLTIVGQGPLERELREQAENLTAPQSVDFMGAVRHEHLPGLYRRADVFVQSSRHEVQAMATLEAAACGAAIGGTCVGVLGELAERGAAIGVPSQDPEALAQGMKQAFTSRETLGVSARELVVRDYSLESVRERLLALYQSLSLADVVEAFQPLARA